MAEYIEREAVKKMFENAQIISDGEYSGYCIEDINVDDIPAADVAPVVHGEWEIVGVYGKTACYRCTACKTEMVDYIDRKGYHCYCHKCGAKMQEAR